jgi:sulfur-oxidizing protein SoxX
MKFGRALVKSLLVTLFLLTQVKLAYAVTITNGAVMEALTNQPGDAVRGRAIVINRQTGLCILCHSGPFPEEQFQGNLAPELSISASHYTAAHLRARLVNPAYFNPDSIMPKYYETDGLTRVAPKYQGQTILTGQEIEDVIAFLQTLKMKK